MTRASALVVVLLATGAVLIATGVTAGELLLFGLFELGFVLVPGVVTYRVLARQPGDMLQQVSIGAGVGHALLLACFIATAALGLRELLWLLPVLGLAGAALLLRSPAERAWPPGQISAGQAVALAGVALAAVVVLAFEFFSQAPLPGSRASVSHYPDLVWAIGIAAEALHHWPITAPDVVGEPLRYHTFAFMEVASVAQQTGLDLPVVSLRLFPASTLLLVTLQLCWAGKRVTGRGWAGPLAAALLLLVGDLDFGAGRPEPLGGLYFSSLYLSLSQLLGLVLFLPAVVVIADLLGPQRPERRWRTAALLAILLFGCAGAKASLLPVFMGGLLVFAAWRRTVTRGWVVALALCAGAFVASYGLLYSGGRTASALDPFQSSFRSFPGRNLELEIGDHLTRASALPLATWVTIVALLVPLAGLAFSRLSLRSPTVQQAWLLGLFVASLAAFLVVDLPGFSQLYFLWYGYTAAVLLSAGGLVEAVTRSREHRARSLLAVVVVGVVAGGLLALAPTGSGAPLVKAYMAVGALLGAVVVLAAAGLEKRPWFRLPVVLAVVALLTAGLLDAPRDRMPDIASRALAGDKAVHREADPAGERGLTEELAAGLEWVRLHTNEDAVLAVHNHLRRVSAAESRYYYYSALAERRLFLGSWDYTDRVRGSETGQVANPFPERLALNDSVYTGAGSGAAAELKRRGVDYVLVDRVNAPPPRNRIPGRVVFRNDALVVYRL